MTGSSVSHQCFCSPIPACVCLDYTCLDGFPWASSPWLRPCMISPVLLSILEVTLDTSLNLICFSHDLTHCLPWAPLPVTSLHLILSAPLLLPAAELPAGHAFFSSTILYFLRPFFVLLYSSSFCYSKPKVYAFHYDFWKVVFMY